MSLSNASDTNREIAVSALDSLARQHCSWMGENFIYVLMWRELGGCRFSERVEEEYEREVPRTFRIIERILELGGNCALEKGLLPYVEHLPRPGRHLAEMFQRERARICDFDPTLRALGQRLSEVGEIPGAELAAEAVRSRAGYLAWLSDPANEDDADATMSLKCPAAEMRPTWLALNRLYAQLTAAIEETIVHTMSLRHAGQRAEAQQCWADSFAYMLYAGDIGSLFARHAWAIELEDPAVSGDVKEPETERSPDASLAADRRRQQELQKSAAAVAEATSMASNPEFSATPIAALRYVEARLQGNPGEPPRAAPPMEAMLRDEDYRPDDAPRP